MRACARIVEQALIAIIFLNFDSVPYLELHSYIILRGGDKGFKQYTKVERFYDSRIPDASDTTAMTKLQRDMRMKQ